jgi:hypothetical protein
MFPSLIVKGGKREEGYSLGCALCQCDVPCEGADPYVIESKRGTEDAGCKVKD